MLNPVDTETEPDSTDAEGEADTDENDYHVGLSTPVSFRLSDIQEQIEE